MISRNAKEEERPTRSTPRRVVDPLTAWLASFSASRIGSTRAAEADGVLTESQADMAVIFNDLSTGCHRTERHGRLYRLDHIGLVFRRSRKQRQRLIT